MPERFVFAILLAAGRATRFGSLKQLAPYRGQPLVTRALREAEAVCGVRTVLVTGNRGEAVQAAASPMLGFRVHNSEYRNGLGSSIATGVAAVADSATAVLLMLADQPLVDRQHLSSMLAAWAEAPDCVIATGYAGNSGVPALFPRRCFGELRALTGDSGARSLLQGAGGRLRTLPFEAAALDVDSPADLRAAMLRQDDR